MSVHGKAGKWQTRWRDRGKQRSRTFEERDDAVAWDEEVKFRKVVAKGRRMLGARVYVVSGADKVKVGVALDPEARLRALQTGSPVPLRLEWVITCPDPLELESQLHQECAEYRSHGEWFEAEPILADLAALAPGRLRDGFAMKRCALAERAGAGIEAP
jgi:hypothetical protein